MLAGVFDAFHVREKTKTHFGHEPDAQRNRQPMEADKAEMRLIGKPVIRRLHIIALAQTAGVFGKTGDGIPIAHMLDHRIGMDNTEAFASKQIRRCRITDHEGEEIGVVFFLLFRADQGEMQAVAMLIDEILTDQPVFLRAAEIKDLYFFFFSQRCFNQLADVLKTLGT